MMTEKYKTHSKNIRINIVKAIFKAKASHIASCLSMVDILSVLYGGKFVGNNKVHPDGSDGLLIISKGHAAVGLYSSLLEFGYITEKEFSTYGENGTRLLGHVSHYVPGVIASTGSLGHGLSIGCGLAYAAKKQKTSQKVYVILSDGELDEGSNWEAILFASHHKLNNLHIIIDNNKIQSFGNTEEVLSLHPLYEKFNAFKFDINEIDGHDHEALLKVFNHLSSTSDERPKCIIANTIKGKGVSFMEDNLKWHYTPPTEEELKKALAELGVSS
jgi:transketolase